MLRVVFSFDAGGFRRCAGWSGKKAAGNMLFFAA